ncbi:hypothetical protein [Roseitranquillus sediminis]|uniref:hypothetical protein n=1 Tax=Roseitranquillus sediminis TaxID=2809051 RepID=UPI001D0C5369|nr:hypothetical protein [Roseitranquillus sediminis]MBM9596132.1 hypothetical protein [Roseitranquillus sediminis]
MRRAVLLSLALVVAGGAAAAQTVRIKSGEHEDFSRLVLYLPEAVEPEVVEGEGSLEIGFGTEWGFEAPEVFYYIPRDRIADIDTSEPGRLRLDLACDCGVTVESLNARTLVVDVADAESNSLVKGAAEPLDVGSDAIPALLPAIMPESTTDLLPTAELMFAPRGAAPAMPEPASELAHETAQALIGQIARAAAQGLVEADVEALERLERPEPENEPEPAPAKPEPVADLELPKSDGHMTITTSIDRDLGLVGAKLGTRKPDACLAADLFDVSDWTPDPEAGGIAALRSRVVGEFDAPDAEAVTALARGYIAMTFGAEANGVISGFGGAPDADILHAMADIVDNGHTRRPGRLVEQASCSTPAALWAALAAPKLSEDVDAEAVSLAFSALPPTLREHLGPTLAERFLEGGDVDTAHAIRNAIARVAEESRPETRLLEARLDLEAGLEERADRELAEIVEETAGLSPEAVALLVERRLENGGEVEDALMETMDSLLYEHRGGEAATLIAPIEIRARLARGEIDAALESIDAALASGAILGTRAERLRAETYEVAAKTLDDTAFLMLAMRAGERLAETPDALTARAAVADRLRSLGLHEQADRLAEAKPAPAPAEPTPVATLTDAPVSKAEMPTTDALLARSASLLERSAALRERLLGAPEDGEATETR